MTPANIKNKRLASLCILGWVLFNYPILSLVNKSYLVFGIPILYVFLFLSWGIFIVLIICVTVFIPKTPKIDSDDKKRFSRRNFLADHRTRENR